MKIVDLNVLLSAVNAESTHHQEARSWLRRALSGNETIGLPWVVLIGFLRLCTSSRVFPQPVPLESALELVASWLARPCVVTPEAGPEHFRHLAALLAQTASPTKMATDAHLAALSLEHGATLVSFDKDFQQWDIPLEVPRT